MGVARSMLGRGHANGYWWLNTKQGLIGIKSLRWGRGGDGGGGGGVNVDFK